MDWRVMILWASEIVVAGCAIGFAMAYLISRRRNVELNKRVSNLSREITKATEAQIDAMQTLTIFRKQYHDAGSPLIVEFKKLRQEIARVKKRLDG